MLFIKKSSLVHKAQNRPSPTVCKTEQSTNKRPCKRARNALMPTHLSSTQGDELGAGVGLHFISVSMQTTATSCFLQVSFLEECCTQQRGWGITENLHRIRSCCPDLGQKCDLLIWCWCAESCCFQKPFRYFSWVALGQALRLKCDLYDLELISSQKINFTLCSLQRLLLWESLTKYIHQV